ncbi:MAG: hypothetical protein EP329_23920 [Deltaproteobacteria bacterium]|nr:MAG: hypothetical protein EP329_23920 [Deltaproteobacteria bacterium]
MLRFARVAVAIVTLGVAGCSTSGGTSNPCANGQLDPGETGVDCGGACGLCPGEGCTTPAVCASQSCIEGACAVATCSDGIQNGREYGVDCGGTCAPCAVTPLSCTNGVQDGAETGVDCGGDCAPCSTNPCANGVQDGAETGVDCGGDCAPCGTDPCANGVQDGAETGVDCGGTCAACSAASCSDGEKNQGETDVDCGGATGCPRCATTQFCGEHADCLSGTCLSGVCRDPSCTDELRNGSETGVDCGGLTCGACDLGEGCAEADDCASGRCDDGTCASCDDGVRSGAETDADCGGDLCDACDQGAGCLVDGDCWGGNCASDQRCGDGRYVTLEPMIFYSTLGFENEALFRGEDTDGNALLVSLKKKAGGSYPGPGVYTLGTGIQASYGTCSVCLLLATDVFDPYFFPVSGTATLEPGTNADAHSLVLTLEDVILEEVEVGGESYDSTPVPDGRGARIEDITISTP